MAEITSKIPRPGKTRATPTFSSWSARSTAYARSPISQLRLHAKLKHHGTVVAAVSSSLSSWSLGLLHGTLLTCDDVMDKENKKQTRFVTPNKKAKRQSLETALRRVAHLHIWLVLPSFQQRGNGRRNRSEHGWWVRHSGYAWGSSNWPIALSAHNGFFDKHGEGPFDL